MYLYISFGDCFHGLGVSQWPPLFGLNDEVSATAIPWCGKPKGTLHLLLLLSLFTLQLSDSRDSSSGGSSSSSIRAIKQAARSNWSG